MFWFVIIAFVMGFILAVIIYDDIMDVLLNKPKRFYEEQLEVYERKVKATFLFKLRYFLLMNETWKK